MVREWLWGSTAAMWFGAAWIGLDCVMFMELHTTIPLHQRTTTVYHCTATEIGPYFSLYELIGYYDYGDFEDAMVSFLRHFDSSL